MCAEHSPENERKHQNERFQTAAESVLSLYKKLDSWLSSDPIIHEVRMRRRLHEGDGVEDVVNVVAEVEDWISYDRLGWGDASRQQRQSCGQRQRRLQLLHCEFLQSQKNGKIWFLSQER